MNVMDNKNLKQWPFIEAKKILKRLKGNPKDNCIFQTGYGPSGLPHIGTFGEVLRTTMVMKAFSFLSEIPTKLFIFSDVLELNRDRLKEGTSLILTLTKSFISEDDKTKRINVRIYTPLKMSPPPRF